MIKLEEVKQLILDGKCTTIYFSTDTLWWTHSAEDLKEATATGKERQRARFKKMIDDPAIPVEQKSRIRASFEMIKESTVPLDPDGAPLYETDKALNWITQAEEKPTHFGKHGLQAFITTHHQNSTGSTFKGWNEVNLFIDSKLN